MRQFRLAVAFLGLSTAFFACGPLAKTEANRAPSSLLTEQGRAPIQAFFNHELDLSYTEPYRHIRRAGADFEEIITREISGATESVDVAVQELRLPKIARALAERRRAGVRVRLILENNYSTPLSEMSEAQAGASAYAKERYHEAFLLMDENGDGKLSPDEIKRNDALVILKDAGVPVIDDTADGSRGSNLMHHKFVVIDGKRVVVSSANFTMSDIHGDFSSPESRGNENSLIVMESPELAALYDEEFTEMWGDGPGGRLDSRFGLHKDLRDAKSVMVGNTLVEVKFSPTSEKYSYEKSTNGFLAAHLAQARSSVDLALFVLSDPQLSSSLRQVHEHAAVRALIEPKFAYRPYSNLLDMLGIASSFGCVTPHDNEPWDAPVKGVGVPVLPHGDMLHHKFGVIDSEMVLVGSHNWTNAANRANDESVLAVHDASIAALYKQEFERLFQHASLGMTDAQRARLKNQQDDNCRPHDSDWSH